MRHEREFISMCRGILERSVTVTIYVLLRGQENPSMGAS